MGVFYGQCIRYYYNCKFSDLVSGSLSRSFNDKTLLNSEQFKSTAEIFEGTEVRYRMRWKNKVRVNVQDHFNIKSNTKVIKQGHECSIQKNKGLDRICLKVHLVYTGSKQEVS